MSTQTAPVSRLIEQAEGIVTRALDRYRHSAIPFSQELPIAEGEKLLSLLRNLRDELHKPYASPDVCSVLGLVKASFDPRLPDPNADEVSRKILADVFDEAGDFGFYFAQDLRKPISRPTDHRKNARAEAVDCVREFMDTIVERLMEDGPGTVSDDLHNDYPNGDSYHHERHVDRYYRLDEAAEVLSQCSDTVETDHGLWSGSDDPETAIGTQAAYTYGLQVYERWRELIVAINESAAIEEILNPEDDTPEEVIEALEAGLDPVTGEQVPDATEEEALTEMEDDEEVQRSKLAAAIEDIIKEFTR